MTDKPKKNRLDKLIFDKGWVENRERAMSLLTADSLISNVI
jgi:predicted rRNA methylase YqxC with S4 and FtsJ domains